jgi:hypothetical protein
MRVPILILALAATPFVAAAAQGQAAEKDPAQCAVADAHRSPTAWAQQHPADPLGRSRTGCAPVVTDPPAQPPSNPSGGGTISITGGVYNDATGAPLSGWVVTLSGPVNNSAVTDGSGAYAFSGLTAGTYVICEQLLGGWNEAYPSSGQACNTGFGFSFSLVDGQSAMYVNFYNATQ